MTRKCQWALALLASAALGRAAPAPATNDDGRIHCIPGGAADADGARGFVAGEKGGVIALDLESGKVLWESKTAGKVVAVVGGRVLVQAVDPKTPNALRFVGLDADKGDKTWESDPAVFPNWVSPVDGPGAGRSFVSYTRLDGNALLSAWKADAWYWGGVPPSPEMLKAAQKHADGVVRIDLQSGKVEMLETAKAPEPGPKVSVKLRNAAAANYGDDRLTVAVAGDYAVSVRLESAGANKQKVELNRWELATEKPLDPVVLAEGAMGYQLVTLPSEGVVLVRDATPAAVKPGEEWTWTVYSLETGKQTAQFSAEAQAEDFTVIGPRAYYVLKGQRSEAPFGRVLPRTLKAVDLKTGKRLWEQPLEAERLLPAPPP